jgi:excisionase family DNA binding protein
VVSDGGTRWLTVGAAARILGGVHTETVRRYADEGLLRSYRMAKGHRRVAEDSVQALAAVLAMPAGDAREAALEELRRRNRGTD